MRALKKYLVESLFAIAVFSTYLLGAYLDQQDEVAANAVTYHQQ